MADTDDPHAPGGRGSFNPPHPHPGDVSHPPAPASTGRRRPRNYGAEAPAWAVGVASVLFIAGALLLEIGVDGLPSRSGVAVLAGGVLAMATGLALVLVTGHRARRRTW